MIRRLKKDVLKQLPAKNRRNIPITPDSASLKVRRCCPLCPCLHAVIGLRQAAQPNLPMLYLLHYGMPVNISSQLGRVGKQGKEGKWQIQLPLTEAVMAERGLTLV